MSRIAKKPIQIPAKTEVSFSGGVLSVKGPLGEVNRRVPPSIDIKIEESGILVTPKYESLETKALWGTIAAHLKNMIKGVNQVYEKRLFIEGIGYKSEIKPNEVILSLGFSHTIKFAIPQGIKVSSDKNILVVSGIDKEAVGSFSAKIRSSKDPEPYKGKGVRYENEIIKRKQGKKAA